MPAQPSFAAGRVHPRGAARWLAAALLAMGSAAALAVAPAVTLHRLGNPADATPALKGPAFYLKGNSEPERQSFEEFTRLIADKPVDVVVIGASFPNYQNECRIIGPLSQVNSCTTLVIGTPEGAQDPAALAAVQQAEIVYFRGGDQCDYVGWQDSAVIEAVEKLVARGGGAGGGSAGLAIQGSLAVYDGCKGSVRSPRALEDPYRDSISFTHDFFAWPYLDNTVTDSHFVERDRMGRLMAFLCRQLAEGRTGDAWGVGIEADTAVLMNRRGMASVYGSAAFVVQADRAPEVCEESTPVSYSGYKVWRLGDGSHYDFANRPTGGYRSIDVEQGVLSADPYEAMP
ncbi:MAG TPA: hypothetical protein VLA16_00510 [Ideonella sp.]|nr:hypothetical protein [Ideonella sp.]